MSSSSTGSDALKYALIATFILGQMVNNTGLRYLMWYLRSLQMIIHLPMLKTIVPGNVSMFY